MRLIRSRYILVAAIFLASAFGFTGVAQAVDCTWTNGDGDGLWNTAANWDNGVPDTSTEVAIFDGTNSGNCTLDVDGLTISDLQINSGYEGKVDLADSSYTLNSVSGFDLGDANAELDLGDVTFNFGAARSSGSINYTAGTLTAGSSTINDNGEYSATYIGTYALNNFKINNWRGTGGRFMVNSGDTLTIGGTLTLTDGQVDNGGNLVTSGNIVQESGFDGGGETLTLDGGAGQTFTINGGVGPIYVLNNASLDVTPSANWIVNQLILNAGTFNGGSVITAIIGTAFTVDGGTFNAETGTISTVAEYGTTFTGDFTGEAAFNNFKINNWRGAGGRTKVNDGDTINVNGTLTLANGQLDAGGTLNAKGPIVQESGFDGGAEVIEINGGVGQTFTIEGGIGPSYNFNNSNLDVTPGADWELGVLTLTSGILNGGTSITTTITSDFTLDGGTFTAQTGEVVLTKNGGPTVTGNVTFNDLTLNLFRNYQNATFTGGTANVNGTLTLTKGMIVGTLNAKGNITLDSTFGSYGTGTGGSGSIVINGDSTQTLTGNATTSAGAIPDIDIQNDLDITGTVRTLDNWTYTSGTVDAGSSTVVFGNADTTIDSNGMSFNNVTLNAATATSDTSLGSAIDIDGTLTIEENGELETTGTDYAVTVGALSMTGGQFDANGSAISCEGNWTKTGGTFTAGTSTLQFTSSGTNFFTPGAATTYNNITINKSAITDSVSLLLDTLTMAADTDLTITTGVFNLVGQDLSLGSGCTSSIDTLGILRLQGGEDLSEEFSNSTAATSGTVSYVGTSTYNELVAGDEYYNLRFNGSGVWNLDAALTVNNDLTIKVGTLGAGSNKITVSGDWDNQGGTFNAGTGEVELTSTLGVDITSGGSSFNDLTFNGSNGEWTPQDALDANGDLTITAGTLISSGNDITVGGSWSRGANGTGFTSGTDTVIFDGTSKTIGTETFYGLTIDAGATISTNSQIDCTTFINNGTFTVDTSDKLVIASGGTFTNSGTITENGIIEMAAASLKITDSGGTEITTADTSTGIFVTLTDYDENLDGTAATDTADGVTVSSAVDSETLTLDEQGAATGIFRNDTGLIYAEYDGSATVNDGTLEAESEQALTASYTDAEDSTDNALSDTVGGQGFTAGFTVSAATPQVAGTGFNVTVTAVNSAGQTSEGYSGTVTLGADYVTPTTGTEELSVVTTSSFTNGIAIVVLNYPDCGTITITATDASDSSLTGTSGDIVVVPYDFSVVPDSATQTVDEEFTMTITARNASASACANYTGIGTITFTTANCSTAGTFSPAASLTSDYWTSGVATLTTAKFDKHGVITFTVTDSTVTTRTGSSDETTFYPKDFTLSVEDPPGSRTFFYTAETFDITATVRDYDNTTLSNYNGTVNITATGLFGVSSTYAFLCADSGTHTFSNIYGSAETSSASLTLSDSAKSSITGATSSITIKEGTLRVTSKSAPVGTTAMTVVMYDSSGAVITEDDSSTFTVTLSESQDDSSASSAATTTSYTLTNGQATIYITNNEAETITITPVVGSPSSADIVVLSGTLTIGSLKGAGIAIEMWRELKEGVREFLER